ncbi:hypothetical protein J2128_000734 [Methanomicrobium sp. W14]|uniref:hypothetical protein n=1 Tax=Methanomicrobium sp. W14 TaxID=2817839 RepID=UPI001AE4D301|nr:hypothetical protein [Methanomicrobium sp. W14]MBP2132813.1 hypothetical protein [Methanomicrobium sp. W14]
MKKIFFTAVLVVLVMFVFLSGCTGDSSSGSKPAATQTPEQTTPSATSTESDFSLTPTATDKMPSGLGVVVNAEKDPIDGKVTVISRGGPGLYMANNINVKLYLSTGETVEKNISPDVNSEAVFTEGTKGDDRVVAVVSMDNGESYKILDEVLKYR